MLLFYKLIKPLCYIPVPAEKAPWSPSVNSLPAGVSETLHVISHCSTCSLLNHLHIQFSLLYFIIIGYWHFMEYLVDCFMIKQYHISKGQITLESTPMDNKVVYYKHRLYEVIKKVKSPTRIGLCIRN